MAKILVMKHVAAEPLGTLDALIRERGHRIRFVNFHRHPDAQPSMERYQGLVVLGGPMNVDQTDAHPHLLTEMEVIERALALKRPVLGICLGAQLLAHVLGAGVRRHVQPEIGWYPLELTGVGRKDPVLGGLAPRQHVFEWHGDSFDLPRDAEHLATTETCASQAFRFGDRAWGFQFHLEMDRALIERWLKLPAYRKELERSGLDRDPSEILRQTDQHLAPMMQCARDVFERFLDQVGPARPRKALPSRHPVIHSPRNRDA